MHVHTNDWVAIIMYQNLFLSKVKEVWCKTYSLIFITFDHMHMLICAIQILNINYHALKGKERLQEIPFSGIIRDSLILN